MSEGCSCDDPNLVVAFDRHLAKPYVDGNPYCRFCLACGRRYFCKPSFWKKKGDKYVIPDGEEEPIHVDKFDGVQYENFFECPNGDCNEPHFGEPEECDNCGANYNWN